MNRKVAAVIALQTLLIIILFWVLVFYGKDEYETYTRAQEEEIDSPQRVSSEHGVSVVTLSPEAQAQSGISTSALKPGKHQSSLSTYGAVISIEPLIELRTRYLAAKADASVIQASIANSRQEYERLLLLNRDNRNISDRAVIAAEALWKADQAKLAAAETNAGNIRDNMRQLWGETLTALATQQPPSAKLLPLLRYQEVLVQVTLPFEAPPPGPGHQLSIAPTGASSKTVAAQFVSASPQTDNLIQGRTFYYRAPASDLRAGMRVTVSMPEGSKNLSGVIVPTSAVVWYGGQAWVYRQQAADKYVRLPLSSSLQDSGASVPNGWFSSRFKPGDRVVTTGAQLLLSEEFKYQIKNENED